MAPENQHDRVNGLVANNPLHRAPCLAAMHGWVHNRRHAWKPGMAPKNRHDHAVPSPGTLALGRGGALRHG